VSATGLRIEEISTAEGFARLAEPWDELVRSMPRPSPFLLHGWLDEWWRHTGRSVRPLVHAAFDDGRLVGGLPLCLVDRRGLQVLSFQGGTQSALADVVLHRAAPASVAKALADRAESSGQDLALLYGLPASSRLVDLRGCPTFFVAAPNVVRGREARAGHPVTCYVALDPQARRQ
jgi:CelD/BcsL family acetyltransferase involved in cellulose biosynthesis